MFNNFNKISYNFQGKELKMFNFSNGYSIEKFKNNIFSKKLNYDLLLDKISIENYSDFKYYYVPFYCGEIINPFLEFPKSQKDVEEEIDSYKAIFYSGISGSSFSSGDLIAAATAGFCAGFDVSQNFGYIIDKQENLNKLKAFVVGSLGTGINYVFRKEDNQWNQKYSFELKLVENFSDSVEYFINNGIEEKNNESKLNEYYDFKNGISGINSLFISSQETYKQNKEILYFIDSFSLTNFENEINGSS
jgi:hypothetical protein